jgi:hypothetical protein
MTRYAIDAATLLHLVTNGAPLDPTHQTSPPT